MPPKKKKSSKEKENGSSSAVPLPATLSKEARDLEAAAAITREKARAVMWREQEEAGGRHLDAHRGQVHNWSWIFNALHRRCGRRVARSRPSCSARTASSRPACAYAWPTPSSSSRAAHQVDRHGRGRLRGPAEPDQQLQQPRHGHGHSNPDGRAPPQGRAFEGMMVKEQMKSIRDALVQFSGSQSTSSRCWTATTSR